MNLRVLHVVERFLNLSENWIYPQVARVPNVDALVLCSGTANLASFPLPSASLIMRARRPSGRSPFLRWPYAIADHLGWYELQTARRVRSNRPQLIHAHFGTQSWQALTLRRLLGVPLISSFYGYDAWRQPVMDPIWKTRYAELFKHGERFLVEGPAMAARMTQIGCPEEKVHIHRLGVDVAKLQYEAKNFSGPLRVAMVGRFTEKKGLADGMRACASAIAGGLNLELTIVGDRVVDDLAGQKIKDELYELAGIAPLSGKVVFSGFLPLPQMLAILAASHILLCPSRHAADGDAEGGSPVVLTEAMAMGLLCIGTRHCDIPGVIIDGVTGYLCDEGDATALARLLLDVPRNLQHLPAITQAGREHVEQHFNLGHQLDGVYAHYQSLARVR